jgi:hypothetical protein
VQVRLPQRPSMLIVEHLSRAGCIRVGASSVWTLDLLLPAIFRFGVFLFARLIESVTFLPGGGIV